MKLSLLTYNMARRWSLPQLVGFARTAGYAGVEFRAEAGHEHGVELERTKAERRQIRDQLEDAYLGIAGIGTSSRFEYPEAEKRQAQIDRTRQYVELAADLGCERVRVFGNVIPAGVRRDDCVKYVGESLRTLGEFADPFGVDVLLEMHGQFNYWGFARGAVEVADHPRVALVYNCDPRDIVAGSVAATYSRVCDLVRHVHVHAFTGVYPYPELFALLQSDGYDGYVSAEIDEVEPTVEAYLTTYAACFRAWAGQPFFPVAEAKPG